MDELKIGSGFLKGMISKLIKRAIKQKTGYEIDIQLNDFEATIIDGRAHVHLNVDAEMDKSQLLKINRTIGLED